MATAVASVGEAGPPPPPDSGPRPAIRKPASADEIPESLPGRWKVTLCVMVHPGHAWIRFENVETGEVRSISRFHYLVGAWYDRENRHWHYPPTIKAGVWMDREQSIEYQPEKYPREKYVLLSTYVDNPRLYKGKGDGRGHGMAVNNCVSYSRDAWYFYTGEYYGLTRIHDPQELVRAVVHHHPEVLERRHSADDLAPPPADADAQAEPVASNPPSPPRTTRGTTGIHPPAVIQPASAQSPASPSGVRR
ncbi:MAG: hypothetical protein IT428_26735 [Planctomycetaceae bacterium]|nr:hypothetical protein [Planctomycetaceae bacterium]